MMNIQIAKFKLPIPSDSNVLPSLMLGKTFSLQQEYIRGRKETVLLHVTMCKYFEEYRGQTDQLQHNCYILIDEKVNFTSKTPTVMVITLSSVSHCKNKRVSLTQLTLPELHW